MSRITDLGIDLGTSNVLIYGRTRGIIFKAPAVIALNRDTNAVIAIGEDAHRMLGRLEPQRLAVHEEDGEDQADSDDDNADPVEVFMR